MLGTFNFNDQKKTIDIDNAVEIGGKKYYINIDLSKAYNIIADGQAHWKWFNECVRYGGVNISAQLAVMKYNTKKVIDAILGDGAFSEIFSERKFTIDDGINLILFLSEALKELGADGTDNID